MYVYIYVHVLLNVRCVYRLSESSVISIYTAFKQVCNDHVYTVFVFIKQIANVHSDQITAKLPLKSELSGENLNPLCTCADYMYCSLISIS